MRPTKNVSRFTGFWPDAGEGVPRKVMVVSYFAETKGVVGYPYGCRRVFEMLESIRFLN
jgi:hypothetical protein